MGDGDIQAAKRDFMAPPTCDFHICLCERQTNLSVMGVCVHQSGRGNLFFRSIDKYWRDQNSVSSKPIEWSKKK